MPAANWRNEAHHDECSREVGPHSKSRGETAPMTQPARKRSGLGRGLASLIPTGPADGEVPSFGPRMGDAAADVVIGGPPVRNGATVVGAVYREIDPSSIDPNPRQPRQAFDE